MNKLKNERGTEKEKSEHKPYTIPLFHSFIINSRFSNHVAFPQSSVAASASVPLAVLSCTQWGLPG
ncbi:hypothetical protein SAMN05444350_11470 [Bacteroides stercorirosoris]|uniref:Uncharacterized protein n=1 Tax=Bacteroides stercorirosoris TaxID=871324 RepID=A0A1M6G996_9BACE|nr:hypothetical protein SAMN05444350_11470 [Bacteroides stercorirosoris]